MRGPPQAPRAAAVLLASLAASAVQAAPAGPPVHQIVIDKLAFAPPPLELHVGDVVEWVNRDIFQHSATASDKSFDVELKTGGSGRAVLKRAGVITYICRYHPGMKGVLTVQPAKGIRR